MFRMRRCSATFLKLTTICDVSQSHDIKFYEAFLSLIFSHKRGRPGDEANMSVVLLGCNFS